MKLKSLSIAQLMFLTSIAKIYPVEVTVARHVHKYYHLFSLYIKKSLLFIAEFLE